MSTFALPSYYPDSTWKVVTEEELGSAHDKLRLAQRWIEERVEAYRFIVVRSGRILYDAARAVDKAERLAIASAAKSVYSSVLGIETGNDDGFSADDRVMNYFPEMMSVPEDRGPKDGRYAFQKDSGITFRQLIGNTSGYMKPNEEPGQVFNYQTYGMNILTHALASRHGLYSMEDPGALNGFDYLIEKLIARPIGCSWSYSYTNFDLHPGALLNIFGYYCQIRTNAHDFARVALLWNAGGMWNDREIIPQQWMRQAVAVSEDIKRNSPESDWVYGMGFWSNEFGKLWPDLPRDGFAACGAGGQYACCFPSRDLVIIQNPGPYHQKPEDRANPRLLEMVIEAVE